MLLETLENFRGCSRLELNKSKTEAVWLGCWATRKDTLFEFRWPEYSVYALGIHFSNDRSKCESLNFDKKLEDLEKIFNSWKRWKLTLLGKINIAKSLGLSKLIYNASVLSLPENFSKRVDKTILDFIWDNKPHYKIKTNTLIGDKNVGGLKMSELELMNKALKASWVRRFNTEVDVPWKIIPNYMTRHLGGFKFHLPTKIELLVKEWSLLKSKNYINGLFLLWKIQS